MIEPTRRIGRFMPLVIGPATAFVRAGVGSARVVVGDAQQQREQHEVGDERRTAVRDERQRDAGERDHPRDAADDEERLQADDGREPGGEQLRERAQASTAIRNALPTSSMNADDDADGADEPELLADRGEHEVGRRVRDLSRAAEAEPGAGEAARSEREPRLDRSGSRLSAGRCHGSSQLSTRTCTWPNDL